MVSRQNIDGRPRPSGVLKTVQDGPAAGLADPNEDLAVAAGDVGGVTGPRRRRPRNVRRYEENGGGRPGYIAPPPDAPPPDDGGPPTEGDYPPGKGPDVPVPPSPPRTVPGGSRVGGGAGYRARTGSIARETTEEQTEAGRGGRFGQQHIERYGRTTPLQAGTHPQGLARYPSGMAIPRWARGVGGGGYGTIPEPLPEEPPPETPPPDEPPPTRPPREDRDGRGGRGRGRRHRR